MKHSDTCAIEGCSGLFCSTFKPMTPFYNRAMIPGTREWLETSGSVDRDLLILERIAELKTEISEFKYQMVKALTECVTPLQQAISQLLPNKQGQCAPINGRGCCRDRSGLCGDCPSR